MTLGTAQKITAAEARTHALGELQATKGKRVTRPRSRDFTKGFMRRQARRWKVATRRSNHARAPPALERVPFRYGHSLLP